MKPLQEIGKEPEGAAPASSAPQAATAAAPAPLTARGVASPAVGTAEPSEGLRRRAPHSAVAPTHL